MTAVTSYKPRRAKNLRVVMIAPLPAAAGGAQTTSPEPCPGPRMMVPIEGIDPQGTVSLLRLLVPTSLAQKSPACR